MSIKKLSAVALSAVMATTLMVPFSALATQTPSVDYTGGDGQPTTRLTLIANDDNLANNNTVEYNQLNAKVQVPVAINYVAQANGNILGPANEQAQIRNFAGFPVQVSNIMVTAGQNVTLVSSAAEADVADEIYLTMTPGSGAAISLADFTASATETTSGSANGTGKRPDTGEDWNIAAAQSNIGTESAVASVLNLNDLGGKIGGFANLDPAQRQEIGQIAWTIKPGAYVNPIPTMPTTVAELSAIGDTLRSGNASEAYVNNVKAMVGQTADFTLKYNRTMTVRLVSVDTSRGLTFQAVDPIPLRRGLSDNANTNAGGWEDSDLRKSLNESDGRIYEDYFAGTQVAAAAISVTNTSFDYNGGNGGLVTASDKFWIASVNNVYGPNWRPGCLDTTELTYSDGENALQFDYYKTLRPDSMDQSNSDLIKKIDGQNVLWWFSSANPCYSYSYMVVDNAGALRSCSATGLMGVVPCFCL